MSDSRQVTNSTRIALRYASLAVASALLIVVASLLPFDFRRVPFDEAAAQFARVWNVASPVDSIADLVANVAMLVPVGFFAAAAGSGGAAGITPRWSVVSIILAAVAGLSLALEFSQLYLPDRIASSHDTVAHLVGSAAGVALWSWVGHGLFARLDRRPQPRRT